MSVRKVRNTWWIDFRFEGQRHRKRSPINTMAGARDYESTLRRRLVKGEPLTPPKQKKVDRKKLKTFAWEWFELYVKNNNKYSEIIGKKYTLQTHLLPHFGNLYLEDISSITIEEYKNKKDKTHLSRKTINNHLTVLRKCLRTAYEWELLDKLPQVKLFKTPPQKFDFFTEKESNKLLEQAEGMWYEMILVALKTGMRLGELIALDWSAIDFNVKTLTVRYSIVKNILGSPKNNKERHIPLTNEVISVLNRRRKESGFVFTYRGKFLKKDYCRNTIARLCKEAGLRRIGWHMLRHSFASHLVQKNAPIKAIQELMGHADIQTTMRYAHLSPSTLRNTVDLLEPENFGQPVVNTFRIERINREDEEREKSIIFTNIKQKTEL